MEERRMRAVDHQAANGVLLITSGDLRLSADQECWPAQKEMEEKLTAAFAQKGVKLVRAHAYDPRERTASFHRGASGSGRFHEHSSQGQAGVCDGRLATTRVPCVRGCAATRGRF